MKKSFSSWNPERRPEIFQFLSTHTSAATFYSVSISKPIPVWFGKKFKILTTRFPNQFQFGLEKMTTFQKQKIPNLFHISLEKRKKVYIFFLFPNLKLSFALKCQGTDAKSECLMLSLVTLWDYGLMITMTVLIVVFNCHK